MFLSRRIPIDTCTVTHCGELKLALVRSAAVHFMARVLCALFFIDVRKIRRGHCRLAGAFILLNLLATLLLVLARKLLEPAPLLLTRSLC